MDINQSKGQGSKVCPKVDMEEAKTGHTVATRQDIQDRLKKNIECRVSTSSPSRDVFEKTVALISALRTLGCNARRQEETFLTASEKVFLQDFAERQSKMSRGYTPSVKTCEGRLLLEYNEEGNPYIVCEHYTRQSRDHYVQYLHGCFDIQYLEAYFNEDTEEMDRIEEEAHSLGYGPLITCNNYANITSQRSHCPSEHRDERGNLYQPELLSLSCDVKVRCLIPLPKYRIICPWILITLKGVHHHPVPLPQKTPSRIRAEVLQLLRSISEDLPDLTPRRFIRHPVCKTYLTSKFPNILLPTLIDLHVSLANREHLQGYIDITKRDIYPEGTGWKGGLLYLKEEQDFRLPPEQHYIRSMLDIPHSDQEVHDEDEPLTDVDDQSLRIVVCMTPAASHRLLDAQYLQCDIGFKRVQGFQEFELATMDRVTNSIAHYRVFQEIEKIVLQDTGKSLQWRHLHYSPFTPSMEGMILSLAVDQHGGQAKGIGLYLQALAQASHLRDKPDLHQPHRLLSELSPYDHLHRLLRLCDVHIKRNIRKCSVPEEVRHKMRSLVCVTHHDWEGTIKAIEIEGGKAGKDWVQDKTRSRFAFQAMCWEKSHIPIEIWRAGDATSNVVESVHSDVNREGIQCTLVGGVQKGRHFDRVKLSTLEAIETSGVRPSYQTGHVIENAKRGVKRKFAGHHKRIQEEDERIQTFNKKLKKAEDTVRKKEDTLKLKRQHGDQQSISKAESAWRKAKAAYDNLVTSSTALPQGSGRSFIVN
ncbi:hypothetical protein H0H93_013296 [Arthromyces matolae]|nr:hypothetical protein H0H93_013296 [Arthromyces matolae]